MERFQRLEARQRAMSLLGVHPDEMDVAHAIVEFERGVAKAGGLDLVELGEERADEFLVVRWLIGCDRVADDMRCHPLASSWLIGVLL